MVPMIADENLTAYLDGEADPELAREIEAALRSDPLLRERLLELEARDRTVRAAFDALLERPTPARLIQTARVSQPPAGRAAILPLRTQGLLRGAPPPPNGAPRGGRARIWVGVAIAAQAAVLAVAVLVMRPSTTPADYEALASSPPSPAANVMVTFRPDTRERELRAALVAVGAQIVGGPTEADAYLLSVPAASRARVIARLRSQAGVEMAEPLDAAQRAP